VKVLFGNRDLIYKIIHATFASVNKRPFVAELGVLDGKNAKKLYEILSPSQLFLIDSWSAIIIDEYVRNNSHRAWVEGVEKSATYYGGALTEQSTFDNLYKKVFETFGKYENVEIIRADTVSAAPILKDKLTEARGLDLVYVDASHQYEAVFDDLWNYQALLGPDGLLQLNDCCHSVEGMKQNLGVLEAAVKFCKAAEFMPVLVTNTDFTDVLLVRKTSPILNIIEQVVLSNDISYVEIPHQLLGALHVKYGKKQNLSFV
jgi:hypothetical protein